MYERFAQLLQDTGVRPYQIAKETGIFQSVFSDWKKGKSSPKMDKLQKIADYFGIPVKFFTNEPPFDAWEYIKDNRKTLCQEAWLSESALFVLIGTLDINSLKLSEYIKFIDAAIESVQITNEGKPNIRVKPWAALSENLDKNKTKKSPAQKAEDRIFPVGGVIPVLGVIRAGAPILAAENIIGYEFADVKNPDDYFYLVVTGDSMINAHIQDGSKVLVHKQNCAENGQIVVCRINGNEATLKRFKQKGDMVILLPENPAYEPIIVSCKEFETGYAEILGVATKVLSTLC